MRLGVSPAASAVASGVYFVNWLEENGTGVRQLIDLNTSRITTFVAFDTGAGCTSIFQTGTIRLPSRSHPSEVTLR